MALSTEAESIEAIQAGIVDNLSTLDEWVDRYAYLVDLGKKLIRHGGHLKSSEYKISGCQSNVWLCTESSGDRLYFSVTSDSTIVAGLMSLLFKVYSGQPHSVQPDLPRWSSRYTARLISSANSVIRTMDESYDVIFGASAAGIAMLLAFPLLISQPFADAFLSHQNREAFT